MNLLKKLSELIYHVRFGRQSNIPWCCIWAFLRHKHRGTGALTIGYGICNKCYEKKSIVKVQRCSYRPMKALFGFDGIWAEKQICYNCKSAHCIGTMIYHDNQMCCHSCFNAFPEDRRLKIRESWRWADGYYEQSRNYLLLHGREDGFQVDFNLLVPQNSSIQLNKGDASALAVAPKP